MHAGTSLSHTSRCNPTHSSGLTVQVTGTDAGKTLLRARDTRHRHGDPGTLCSYRPITMHVKHDVTAIVALTGVVFSSPSINNTIIIDTNYINMTNTQMIMWMLVIA